jgi:chromosome segregation ATPase|mmetsp:Transcript_52101/g.82699  ORF Transcript_52101/g.82699 Transcript_52101/m.82699 type:complete len:278 (+) Transcript_52101:62-895(+)|eukprot:CAMPEP_0169062782 /NCGR_PEP_ID=MMETSP1015-20121227/894_1 /TAXON_ID=342587 /ORGANISM="Karlodinium micrum, Strain CCMP2283" /LENGTH=277 /DNA_ID=CAMNT_0009120993 /DNA_START=61 /DNA_END=894 /DNA_ORIENTATION=-
MVTVEDILSDSLSATIKEWFEPSYEHPFLSLNILSVSDATKPIPKRWVDDIQIEDGFMDEGDAFNLGSSGGGTWSNDDGKQRLREALARLELPEETLAHVNLDRMGRHDLAAEKRRVKQELKRYDGDFRKQFSRLPTHTEKEPMRPLYVYYRRLKTMITQAEQNKTGRGRNVQDVGGFGPRESLTTIPDAEETPRTAGNSLEEQISALEERIETLQGEKIAVRAKLQSFQERFISENNRKIRFHKDILPIERDYRMYKNLKEEIMKAESQLRDLRAE